MFEIGPTEVEDSGFMSNTPESGCYVLQLSRIIDFFTFSIWLRREMFHPCRCCVIKSDRLFIEKVFLAFIFGFWNSLRM